MKKSINEYITLSKMERNRIKYIIVEGKSDPKIYNYIINKENIKIITPSRIHIPNKNYIGGCLSVISIMDYIPDMSEKYFLGVIDKDLHPISMFRKKINNSKLIVLDYYSIESYFFNFLTFKKIIELVTDLSQEQVNNLFTENVYEEFIKSQFINLYNLTLFILFDFIFENKDKKYKNNKRFIKKGKKNLLARQNNKIKNFNKKHYCKEAKKGGLTYDCDDVNHIFLSSQKHKIKESISNYNKIGYIRNFIRKKWAKKYNISNIDDINYVIKNYTKGKWLLSYFSYATLEYIKSIYAQGCVQVNFPCGECTTSNKSQCLYLKSNNKKYKEIPDALISNESIYNSREFQKIRDLIEEFLS